MSVVLRRAARGLKLVKGMERVPNGWNEMPVSYLDAARLLFQMKDLLQSSQTGRSCLDQVAEERRRS